MKLVRNQEVVKAWKDGVPAKAGALWTDGEKLYSYRLLIGTTENGKKVVRGFARALGGRPVSQTTSTHVLLAAREAADIVAVLNDEDEIEELRPVKDFDL